jgi:hypothetical protein
LLFGFYRQDSSDEAVVLELLTQHSGYGIQGYLFCLISRLRTVSDTPTVRAARIEAVTLWSAGCPCP